jgi:hypothetical protein
LRQAGVEEGAGAGRRVGVEIESEAVDGGRIIAEVEVGHPGAEAHVVDVGGVGVALNNLVEALRGGRVITTLEGGDALVIKVTGRVGAENEGGGNEPSQNE